jgi:hypothetical protein
VRTNPKNGKQGAGSSQSGSKSGSIVARVPRRRTGPTKSSEAAALTAASEKIVPAEVNLADQIAKLAYSLWEARGRNGGSAEEDWCRAEQEILARLKT